MSESAVHVLVTTTLSGSNRHSTATVTLLFSYSIGHAWLYQSESVNYLLALFPCSLKVVQIKSCVSVFVPCRALLLLLARRAE